MHHLANDLTQNLLGQVKQLRACFLPLAVLWYSNAIIMEKLAHFVRLIQCVGQARSLIEPFGRVEQPLEHPNGGWTRRAGASSGQPTVSDR